MTEAAAPPPGPRPRIGVVTKLFYGFGSVAFGIKDNGFRVFLLLFYNQVVGLPPALVSTAVLVAMLIDCLIDPVVGQISDNWRSKWGRRHPFMYASAVPVALSFLLLWNPPMHWSHGALFWYLVATAVIVRSFITLYEVPSASLTAEFTDDYDERTSLLGYRFAFGWWGGIILTAVMFFVLMKATPEYPRGQLNPAAYAHYGYVAAAMMFVAIVVSAAGTHRLIPWLRQPPEERPPTLAAHVKEMFATLSNRPFAIIVTVGLFTAIAQGVSFSLAFYFSTYFWELNPFQTGILLFDNFVGAGLALAVAPMVSRRAGKKRPATLLLALSIAIGFIPLALRLIGFLPDNGSPWLVPILFIDGVFRGTAGITASILITSMLTDVVENSEARTGRRSEGLFFAFSSLVQKAVSGVGVLIAGLLLSAVHFPPGARSAATAVDPAILRNLALVYMPSLVLLYGAGLVVLQWYRISRESHEQTLQALAKAEALEESGAPLQVP